MSDASVTGNTSKLVRVCAATEIANGEMKAANVEDFPPLAVFKLEGAFYVTANLCTHQIALLTNGYFEDGVVECPLHGGAFDVKTGEPAQPPCEVPLAVFPVIVEDGQIYVMKT